MGKTSRGLGVACGASDFGGNHMGVGMSAVAAEMFHVEHSERDARTMNHMDRDTKLVHIRLEAWGQWNKGGLPREWPEVSMMGRIGDYGPNGAGQQSKPPVTMSDSMARLDAAVAKLGDIDKRVIQGYYLHWQDWDTMARKVKMRRRQFQNVLRRARWRIAGYLSAVEG